MCLIIASPSGKRISDKILDEAASTNRDGAGIAWSEPKEKKIHFRKGLTTSQVKEILDGEAKGKAWVIHFRIATVGGVSSELTHPFTVDQFASTENEGIADSVLFQNGTFSNWREYLLQAVAHSGTPIPQPPWSDSRAIAFCLGVYGKHLLSLLDNTSRFLVFDANEPTATRMMLWGDWHDYEDFKFSNRGTSAFHTSSTHFQSNRSNHGGGSAHPPKHGVASGGTESASTDSATTLTSSEPSPTSSGQPVTSPRTGPVRTYKTKPGYDAWRSFSQSGVYIRADNEPAHQQA